MHNYRQVLQIIIRSQWQTLKWSAIHLGLLYGQMEGSQQCPMKNDHDKHSRSLAGERKPINTQQGGTPKQPVFLTEQVLHAPTNNFRSPASAKQWQHETHKPPLNAGPANTQHSLIFSKCWKWSAGFSKRWKWSATLVIFFSTITLKLSQTPKFRLFRFCKNLLSTRKRWNCHQKNKKLNFGRKHH